MADIIDFDKWKKDKEGSAQKTPPSKQTIESETETRADKFTRPTLGRLSTLDDVKQMQERVIEWLDKRNKQYPHRSERLPIDIARNTVMSPRAKWDALREIYDVNYHATLACAFILAKEDSKLKEDQDFHQNVQRIWERSMIHVADPDYGASNLKFMQDITADLATVLSGFLPDQFDAQAKSSEGQMLFPASMPTEDFFKRANEKIKEDWRLATVGPQTYDESAAEQKANREAPPKALQIIQVFAKSHPQVGDKFNEDLQMLIASFNGNHMDDPNRKAFIRRHRRNDVLEGRLSTEYYMFANALAYLGQEGLAEAKKYMQGLDVDPELTLAEWGSKRPKE